MSRGNEQDVAQKAHTSNYKMNTFWGFIGQHGFIANNTLLYT